MAILRFVTDIEAAGDVTSKDGDEMASKIKDYAQSVVAPNQLGEKQGEIEDQYWWHVHHSDPRHICSDCAGHSTDEIR